jgi:DNA polymerase-3 subunit delta
MKADRGALAAAIRKLDPACRLFLFHGADTSASADLARTLARQFADPNDPLGETVIDGKSLTADPAALVAAASEISMFGGTRLIRVDDGGDDVLPAVAQVLDAAATGNPVVVVAGTLKKGSKLLARVEGASNAMAYASYLPEARDIAATIAELAAEVGVRPTRAAAALLAEATGGDRGILRQEIGKLALYLDATPTATVAAEAGDIAAIGADLGDADFTALVDGVAGGKPEVADRQLRGFAASGVPGITLLRTVARRFWLLLDLRAAVDGGASASRAVDGARPPVFWKEKGAVTAQLGAWRTPAIRGVLARLLAAERAVKRSGSAGDVAVAQLLLGIAQQGKR